MQIRVVMELLFLFLVYSFLGWTLEVIAIAIKEKKFVNRGIISGPFCLIYGIVAVIITVALRDIDTWYGLFIGSLIYATFIEFIAGKILEKFNKHKWWDYSQKKFNLDGYICLEYSLIWGILGVLALRVFNPFFIFLFHFVNFYVSSIVVIAIIIFIIIDFLASFLTLKHFYNHHWWEKISNRYGAFLLKITEKRLMQAYPSVKFPRKRREKSNEFAPGCGFYKLFVIFVITSFVGALIEIIFCRYSMHRFMSRSSLVWGQFSIVWGFAFALAALLLHRYYQKSNTFLFITGAIMGGAFEYICSVFTEFFFGTIFWDYSKIPFNINGRINLLFCLVWGFATVIFIKYIYKYIIILCKKIPRKWGMIVANILIVFFAVDFLVTGSAMLRYKNRHLDVEASNIVEKLCDKYFDDDYMKKRWPNMKDRY